MFVKNQRGFEASRWNGEDARQAAAQQADDDGTQEASRPRLRRGATLMLEDLSKNSKDALSKNSKERRATRMTGRFTARGTRLRAQQSRLSSFPLTQSKRGSDLSRGSLIDSAGRVLSATGKFLFPKSKSKQRGSKCESLVPKELEGREAAKMARQLAGQLFAAGELVETPDGLARVLACYVDGCAVELDGRLKVLFAQLREPLQPGENVEIRGASHDLAATIWRPGQVVRADAGTGLVSVLTLEGLESHAARLVRRRVGPGDQVRVPAAGGPQTQRIRSSRTREQGWELELWPGGWLPDSLVRPAPVWAERVVVDIRSARVDAPAVVQFVAGGAETRPVQAWGVGFCAVDQQLAVPADRWIAAPVLRVLLGGAEALVPLSVGALAPGGRDFAGGTVDLRVRFEPAGSRLQVEPGAPEEALADPLSPQEAPPVQVLQRHFFLPERTERRERAAPAGARPAGPRAGGRAAANGPGAPRAPRAADCTEQCVLPEHVLLDLGNDSTVPEVFGYTVVYEKPRGTANGATLSTSGEFVKQIAPGGLWAKHNQEKPADAIKVGDRIISVNGESYSSKFVDLLCATGTMTIRFERRKAPVDLSRASVVALPPQLAQTGAAAGNAEPEEGPVLDPEVAHLAGREPAVRLSVSSDDGRASKEQRGSSVGGRSVDSKVDSKSTVRFSTRHSIHSSVEGRSKEGHSKLSSVEGRSVDSTIRYLPRDSDVGRLSYLSSVEGRSVDSAVRFSTLDDSVDDDKVLDDDGASDASDDFAVEGNFFTFTYLLWGVVLLQKVPLVYIGLVFGQQPAMGLYAQSLFFLIQLFLLAQLQPFASGNLMAVIGISSLLALTSTGAITAVFKDYAATEEGKEAEYYVPMLETLCDVFIGSLAFGILAFIFFRFYFAVAIMLKVGSPRS